MPVSFILIKALQSFSMQKFAVERKTKITKMERSFICGMLLFLGCIFKIVDFYYLQIKISIMLHVFIVQECYAEFQRISNYSKQRVPAELNLRSDDTTQMQI